jgi:hypothetical protein
MKKLLALLLVLVLLFLMGCTSVVEPVGTDANPPVTTTTLPAPREWPGVPQAYWAVLDEQYLHYLFSGSGNFHGYAVADINGDGVPELILMFRWTDDEEPRVGAILTLDGDEPVTVTSFAVRHGDHGVITADGTIYRTFLMLGANIRGLSSYRLVPNTIELTTLTQYRFEAEEIAEDENWAMWHTYRNPPNLMQLEFIPLGNET